MDSANSGSLQSSSGGGDDDFDAACSGGAVDSSPLSALLRHPPSPSVPAFGGGSSLIYGLQELGTPPPLSHWCPTTAPLQPTSAGASASPPSLHCHGGLAASGEAEADHAASPPRGSRKRARASRRAPTTVLTTDTSNFRAMVQEFTGIPDPPFAASPGARSRFDHLFPSRPSAAALPQYLLRPLAHKLHHASSYEPPFTSPTSTSPQAPANVAIAAPAASAPGATAAVGHGDSYQHLTTAAPSALLGMQDHTHTDNSYLSFQSTLGAQLDAGDAKSSYPMFDRGVAPASPAPTLQHDPTDFLGLAHGIMTSNSEGTHLHLHSPNDDQGDELSGLVGGAGGCKATYSSAPPLVERNGRSPPAGVSTATTTATAGMRTHQGVESWVCSTSE